MIWRELTAVLSTVLLEERDEILAGRESGSGIIRDLRELDADNIVNVYERRSPSSRCQATVQEIDIPVGSAQRSYLC
jgi:hypothetical protein